MSDREAVFANLTPEKRELLELLLREDERGSKLSSILQQPRDKNIFPLSFAQQRLWFLDQLEPLSPLYNIPTAARFVGQLNIEALEHSFAEVISRHESLRTTFDNVNGEFVQIIHPDLKFELPIIDFSQFQENHPEDEMLQVAQEFARLPFDLRTGPLVRACLYRLKDDVHVLVAVMHHIISDGWSMGILFKEIGEHYAAYVQGKSVFLPNLAIQYADFTVWQREKYSTDFLNEQFSFWNEKLGGELPILDLPIDYSRPSTQSIHGNYKTFHLPSDLTLRLKRLAAKEGVTLFTLLLAAFKIFLYRITNQDDIIVGTPVAGRNQADLEGVIGFFANTLAIRSSISKSDTFQKFLHEIKNSTVEALEHQDLPFEMLVDRLQTQRDMSYPPVFQVMFVMQNAPMPDQELPLLTLSAVEIHTGTSKFDLTLIIGEDEGITTGIFEYAKVLFNPKTIDNFVDIFLTLLHSIITDPAKEISNLNLINIGNRNCLLPDAARIIPVNETLDLIFQRTAERNWEREALGKGNERMTYGELEEKSNQIGRWLRKQGVKVGDLVVLRQGRTMGMVATVLGVLKAGGAYVPLELSNPEERQEHILREVKAAMGWREPLVLTDEEGKVGMAEGMGEVKVMEDAEEEIAGESEERLESGVKGEDLAYVIYTSGSTGKPKGVMVSHENVVRLMEGTRDWYGFNEKDRWTLFHSYAFDFSVWEMWGALMNGGKLEIVGKEESQDGEAFYRLLEREGITVLNQTPSAFRSLMRAEERLRKRGEGGELKLRYVIFGGEALEIGVLREWFERHGGEKPRLVNMYGITETTVHVTYRVIREEEARGGAGSMIGVPLPDLYVYVLDENLEPQPVGIAGEMYIGGGGLARGYLNQEGMTKERFIENPHRKGERLYRSGDIGRWVVEGELEYLGRRDDQVKVRGYRIELGEIENVLGKHEGVEESVVVVREREGREKQIVGYVVRKEGERLSGEELRKWVGEKLPEYMQPAAIEIVEAIPLTVNGKVDRKALPEPKWEKEGEERGAAKSGEEEIIAGIWSEVLGKGRVGVKDNFFELGGHSLLAAQMIGRVREVFGVEIGLRVVFEKPTVEGIAESLREKREETGEAAGKVEKRAEGKRIPLTYGQERLWFLERFQPGEGVYHIPVVLRVKGEIEEEKLEKSLKGLVKRHESLRTRLKEEGGVAEQEVMGDEWVEEQEWVREVDGRGKGEREKREIIEEEILRPFDLEKGPLLRMMRLKEGEREQIVVLVMHHLVGDGWSMGRLVKEMEGLYRGEELEEMEVQYGDYAVWQREGMSGEVLEKGLKWWKEELRGLEVLEVKGDHPRPAVQTTRGGHVRFGIGEEMKKGLEKIGREEGATMFMSLMGVLGVLLRRYTGQEEVSVGTVIANRGQAELEKVIGLMVNTVVLRVKVEGGMSYREVLRGVKEAAIRAYMHGEVPFERVVKAMGVERDTSRTPLFGVMMVMQNAPIEKIELEGVEVEVEEVETGRVPFDLSLIVEEIGEGLEGVWEYNTDLFERETIERMAGHYEELMRGLVREADEEIGKVNMLTEGERRLVTESWNQTDKQLPENLTLPELFRHQALRTPNAIAVQRSRNGLVEKMTYQELNFRSEILAIYLKTIGLLPNELVGIFVERSFEMLVSLFGVMKAGGAFVPLDPGYPQERIQYMIRDSNLKILLGKDLSSDYLQEDNLKKIDLLRDWNLIVRIYEQQDGTGNNSRIDEKNLAYVMYTSGSTGVPKGVMISHRSIVNHNLAVIDAFTLNQNDKVLQFSTLNFDTSLEEIFPALLCGATIVLPPEKMLINGSLVATSEELIKLINNEQITVLDLPTAFWHEWVSELRYQDLELLINLRLVVVGGEKATRERYERWLSITQGNIRWINTYGPTEGTIIATLYEPNSTMVPDNDIPIGRPINNVKVYVLDEDLTPVPIGVPGELCIGGMAVAQGYLNKPELSDERFIEDPFATGLRIYKTGDRARWLADGNLEYLGRIDEQVKVRGFRVELGEVETAIRKHASIQDVVVIPDRFGTDKSTGTQRLLAYVVFDQFADTEPGQIKDYLKNKLPEYMIPAVFMKINEIPLTPNKKVDRNALPRLEEAIFKSEIYEAPANERETILVTIFSKVLGLNKVGVNDNFFELGGDSILSLQIIAQAAQNGLRITVQQMFEAQTIRRLAEIAEEGKVDGAEQGLITGKLPLTPIQRWFFDQDFEEPWHWNQALMLDVTERIDEISLNAAVNKVLVHHDALRSRFKQSDNEVWEAEISGIEEDNHLEIIRMLGIEAEEQPSVVLNHVNLIQSSLDLENGRVLRIVYFDYGDANPGKLLIVVHHLVIDGVSWRILIDDLWNCYKNLRNKKDILLPVKTTSYKNWSYYLVNSANEANVLKDLDYWSGEKESEMDQFPLDNPGAANIELSNKIYSISVSEDETQILLSRPVTLYSADLQDVLISSLLSALYHWRGISNISIELEGMGRNPVDSNIDLSRTVGWFTNLYPVYFSYKPMTSPQELLQYVKEKIRKNQRKSLNYMVLRYLSDLDHKQRLFPSVVPISFNYLGQIDQINSPELPFVIASDTTGLSRSLMNKRCSILEINCGISIGKLSLDINYSNNLHFPDSIIQLATFLKTAINDMVIHLKTTTTGQYSPVDFPLAGVDQQKLDEIVRRTRK